MWLNDNRHAKPLPGPRSKKTCREKIFPIPSLCDRLQWLKYWQHCPQNLKRRLGSEFFSGWEENLWIFDTKNSR
jgi:hypothetical protein